MSAIWFHKTEFARLVAEGRAIDELSIGRLPRVAAAVEDGSGPFRVQFDFKALRNNIVLADGKLSGRLKLRCQRCLDTMQVDIDATIRLALSVIETEPEAVPEDYEPLTIPAGAVRVVDLVEDEVLLALPIAARHSNDDCGQAHERLQALQPSAASGQSSPFAGLAEMLRARTD